MGSSTLIPQFVKVLDVDQINSDELSVPWKFVHTYGNGMNDTVKLRIRNGYMIRVVFDRRNERFTGVGDLFRDFGMKGGEILIFRYKNRGTLKVYIVGRDLGEIEYPDILHSRQDLAEKKTVMTTPDGWHFVHMVKVSEKFVDELNDPARSFMVKCLHVMGKKVKYVLNNWEEFRGYYYPRERRFIGFGQICEALGIESLNVFSMLVFSFDMTKRLHVSFYDSRCIEIDFNLALPSVELVESLRRPSYFAIEVRPCHMLPYCYGVDIGVEFKSVTEHWGRNEEIRVYKGERGWTLRIRKRADWKRTSILNGWTVIRDDLQLGVGDKCYFQWKDQSYRHFTVDVVRAVLPV